MSDIDWRTILKIIAFILQILAGGGSLDSAISKAANKFDLSESEVRSIWNNR